MIKDYNILKHHCSVNYTIGNEKKQIGNLSDNQLLVAKRILSNKAKLTDKESQQLKAITYISDYRAEYSLNKLLEEVKVSQNTRMIGNALKKAKIIEKWILKNYK